MVDLFGVCCRLLRAFFPIWAAAAVPKRIKLLPA
jgi:hypothetical protein